MARFMIEMEHDREPIACVRAGEVLARTGSHFLTRADWGCKDGVHKAWVIIELETKAQALQLVPAEFQARATVVQLNSFSLDEVEALRRAHGT